MGLGGDSEVRFEKNGEMKIGPLRKGVPVAFGGPVPTPTDAMITLGLLEAGDRSTAQEAMEVLGGPMGLDARATAETVLEKMAGSIAESAENFLNGLNSRPVYTIHEVLREEKIWPDSVIIIGGPAPGIADYVGKAFGLPHRVPEHFAVANAVGAAVARVTSEVTVKADTERGTVVIPEADIQEGIDHGYSMDDAGLFGREILKKQALEIGADAKALDISITEKQEFNMIRGYSRTGKNIRLKMCITPGLIPEWS
jgi:N-methylhydantoinase A/oxoprolinase/acetone carboxylase beta subunit